VSAGEGTRFAEVMNEFSAKVKSLGPLGSSEGKDIPALQAGLDAATQLVPYIKLVERERLRVPQRTEDGYHKFFGSQDFEDLFKVLVLEKLDMSRIMGMVRARTVLAVEIAADLDLEPTDVARYLDQLAQRGMVRINGPEIQLAVAA
jgi:F420-non-reducing hydrogenase iron-sulfur subunit